MNRRYHIAYEKAAQKAIRKMDRQIQRRVLTAIGRLADDPRPKGCKKLAGEHEAIYRLRVGDYRVIYRVEDGRLRVLVITVGHRRDVYARRPRK